MFSRIANICLITINESMDTILRDKSPKMGYERICISAITSRDPFTKKKS